MFYSHFQPWYLSLLEMSSYNHGQKRRNFTKMKLQLPMMSYWWTNKKRIFVLFWNIHTNTCGWLLCVSRKMYYKSSIEVESQMYAIKLTLIGWYHCYHTTVRYYTKGVKIGGSVALASHTQRVFWALKSNFTSAARTFRNSNFEVVFETVQMKQNS